MLRILYKMEFFAGGGGLSHMAQELEHLGRVVSAWANDINPSACATYAANKPDTFVSPLLGHPLSAIEVQFLACLLAVHVVC